MSYKSQNAIQLSVNGFELSYFLIRLFFIHIAAKCVGMFFPNHWHVKEKAVALSEQKQKFSNKKLQISEGIGAIEHC